MSASSWELDTIQLQSIRKGVFHLLGEEKNPRDQWKEQERKGETSQPDHHPHKYYVVGVPKRHSRQDLSSGGQFLLLLYKSLLQNSSSITSSGEIIMFGLSGLWWGPKDAADFLIYATQHSTHKIRRKQNSKSQRHRKFPALCLKQLCISIGHRIGGEGIEQTLARLQDMHVCKVLFGLLVVFHSKEIWYTSGENFIRDIQAPAYVWLKFRMTNLN